MLRQQLQETKETLAARDAEVQELKTRVADLEKLQQQQQQLLTMKNSELSAAQQNLAKTNQAAAPVQAQQPVPASPEPASRAPIWLWGGIALIAVALLGWWLSNRRRSAPPVTRLFDTAALAASVPTTEAVVVDDITVADDVVYAAQDVEVDEEAMTSETASTPVSAVSAAWGGISTAEPTWHAGVPAATATPVAADAINASQQLELARAYLDMGDDKAARELLRDVLDGRDPAARAEAARLLRDL